MTSFHSEFLNRFAEMTGHIFQSKERFDQLLENAQKAIVVMETVESLLKRAAHELITVEEAAQIFKEAPETLHRLLKEKRTLLRLDNPLDSQITIRNVFHLATLLPENLIAQECVRQLLDRALIDEDHCQQNSLFC